jgi:hypothetical protein
VSFYNVSTQEKKTMSLPEDLKIKYRKARKAEKEYERVASRANKALRAFYFKRMMRAFSVVSAALK